MKNIILLLTLLFAAVAQGQVASQGQLNYQPPANLLQNAGFERGQTKWTSSGGTVAIVTSGANLLFDKASLTFDASAASQYVQSALYTVPVGLQGGNCGASIYYKGGDANLALKVLDGSANVLATQTLAAATYTTKASVSFPCPTSGQFRLRVESTADAAIVALDNAQLGELELLKVAEATFIGSVYFAPTLNCTWSTTASSYSPFTSDADCPAPTIEFNPFGYIQSTDADLPQVTLTNLPAGNYKVVVEGGVDSAGSAANFAGLAVSDSITRSGDLEFYVNAGDTFPYSVAGMFNYSSAGTRTYDLRGKKAGGTTLRVSGSTAYRGPRFLIYRFPLTSELAFRPDAVASSWSGYHDNTCSWVRTDTALGDPTADATCGFGERTNRNFGTVTSYESAGNKLPGIVFTPVRAGKYQICANFSLKDSVAAVSMAAELSDLTPTVIGSGEQNSDVVGNRTAITICGQYVATDVSSKTVRLRTRSVGSGTVTVESASNAVEWTVVQIDQAIPAPLLVNSVTSNSSGVERVERASVVCSGSSSVTRQSGSWVSSVGNNASGSCVLTLAAGIFSGTPTCVMNVSAAAGGNTVGAQVAGLSSTSVTITGTYNTGGVTIAETSYTGHLICMGPR